MRLTFSAIVGLSIDYLTDISRHLPFWRENATKVCDDEENISGRIVIVTGSNTGIGKQVALQMAKRGAVVIMAVRNLDKGRQAAEEIKRNLGQSTTIEVLELDLADLQSIHNFVFMFESTYPHLDTLINNAGIMDLCPDPTHTKNGFETNLGVNHLGPFLLTRLLLPSLERSPDAHSRIVCLTSTNILVCPEDFMQDLMLTQKRNTGNLGHEQYNISKLCNSIAMMKLSKDMTNSKVKVYQLCPGLVKTEIFRNIQGPIRKSLGRVYLSAVGLTCHQGAETVVYCAVAESILRGGSGEIYRFTQEWKKGTKLCRKYFTPSNCEITNKLYKWSEKLVGLTP